LKTHEVTAGHIQLGEGHELKLSKEQAELREHALQPVEGKKGVYLTTAPVCFVNGEKFGYDGPHLGDGILSKLDGGIKPSPAMDADEALRIGSESRVPTEEELDPADEDEDGDPGEGETTVAELAKRLDRTIGATIEVLTEYDITAHRGADNIPLSVADQIVKDFDEATPDDEDEDADADESQD